MSREKIILQSEFFLSDTGRKEKEKDRNLFYLSQSTWGKKKEENGDGGYEFVLDFLFFSFYFFV